MADEEKVLILSTYPYQTVMLEESVKVRREDENGRIVSMEKPGKSVDFIAHRAYVTEKDLERLKKKAYYGVDFFPAKELAEKVLDGEMEGFMTKLVRMSGKARVDDRFTERKFLDFLRNIYRDNLKKEKAATK